MQDSWQILKGPDRHWLSVMLFDDEEMVGDSGAVVFFVKHDDTEHRLVVDITSIGKTAVPGVCKIKGSATLRTRGRDSQALFTHMPVGIRYNFRTQVEGTAVLFRGKGSSAKG
jgi:hypothetical protein